MRNQSRDKKQSTPYISSESTCGTSKLDSNLYEHYKEFISPSYPSFLTKLGLTNVAIRAEGAIITDSKGKAYIDCVAGSGIFNLGHNHPEVVEDVIAQLREMTLLTKPLITEIQVKLAESLSVIAPGDMTCSFVCNSGSEAIDSALKLARLSSGKKRIITAENSFHGYTFGALSASGIPSFKRLYEPLVPEIVHVQFGSIAALRNEIDNSTAAVLLEPIQHEAGVLIPEDDYFPAVRSICDETGTLLILDEIKTGFGKTGWIFACDNIGIIPDILVLGKSMGGGLIPIGALIANKGLWRKFGLSFPMSASSFAGNTLACRAALTTIEILQQKNLLEECRKKGMVLLEGLRQLGTEYPNLLRGVKGIGLLIGIETADSQKALQLSKQLIRHGVLVLPAFGNNSVLMIEPPIVISFEQIHQVLEAFRVSCEEM